MMCTLLLVSRPVHTDFDKVGHWTWMADGGGEQVDAACGGEEAARLRFGSFDVNPNPTGVPRS